MKQLLELNAFELNPYSVTAYVFDLQKDESEFTLNITIAELEDFADSIGLFNEVYDMERGGEHIQLESMLKRDFTLLPMHLQETLLTKFIHTNF